MVGAEFIRWSWIVDHRDDLQAQLIQHLQLTAIAVGIGLAISFPLAVLAHRHRWVLPPVTWVTGLIYTIPSLALFALLVPYTGLGFLTAEIGLIGYTLLILIRNIVAGLAGVPADVKDAAWGMGYTRRQLLWRVELPLALPVIMAGIRIATVSTIGLVTVTSLIGMGGLGLSMLQGLRQFFPTAALAGGALSVILAVAVDALLLQSERWLSPWSRRARARLVRP